MPVTRDELLQLPHVNPNALGDRVVNLMDIWDGESWHSLFPTGGKLMKMKIANVAEGNYLAKSAEHESDLFLPFVDLMWQRASYPEIVPLIMALEDDFRNMGTSLAKLKHFFVTRQMLSDGAARTFASTELEYLVVLARTVFDLLQEMISKLWDKRAQSTNHEAERLRKGRKLPETFSKLCLKDKAVIRTTEELEQDFGLPRPMAEKYAAAAPFFVELRALRDGIIHRGDSMDRLYDTERGFCIHKDSKRFELLIPMPDHFYNENLVSLLPWLSALIMQTMGTCTSLMAVFASVITLPEEMCPGYRIFVRGPNNDALLEVVQIANGRSPWWDIPAETAKPLC